jgi:hypothetical protein
MRHGISAVLSGDNRFAAAGQRMVRTMGVIGNGMRVNGRSVPDRLVPEDSRVLIHLLLSAPLGEWRISNPNFPPVKSRTRALLCTFSRLMATTSTRPARSPTSAVWPPTASQNGTERGTNWSALGNQMIARTGGHGSRFFCMDQEYQQDGRCRFTSCPAAGGRRQRALFRPEKVRATTEQ